MRSEGAVERLVVANMDKLNNMLSTHITSIQYKDEVEEQAYNAYHAAFLNEAITLDEFKAYAPKSLQGTSADEAVFPEAAFKNAQAKTTFFGSKQKTSYSTKNKYEDTDLGNDGDMWVYNNLEALTQRGKQSPVGIHSPHPPTPPTAPPSHVPHVPNDEPHLRCSAHSYSSLYRPCTSQVAGKRERLQGEKIDDNGQQ